MIILTLFSKPCCHLCDDMKAVVARIVSATRPAVTVTEIDISNNRELEERYGAEIPVLMMNGRKVAKYRVTEKQLRRALSGGNKEQLP